MEKRITIKIIKHLKEINKPLAEQTIFITNKKDIARQIRIFLKNNKYDLKTRTKKLMYIPEIDFVGLASPEKLAEKILRRLKWIS